MWRQSKGGRGERQRGTRKERKGWEVFAIEAGRGTWQEMYIGEGICVGGHCMMET